MKKLFFVLFFFMFLGDIFSQSGENVRLRTISSNGGVERGVRFHLIKLRVSFPPSSTEYPIEVRLDGVDSEGTLAERRVLVRNRALTKARALWITIHRREGNTTVTDYDGTINTTLP